MENFNFTIPLQKGNQDTLTGIASAITVDRDEERMSENALNDMVADIKKEGVNLFVDHDHKVDCIVGFVKDAQNMGGKVKIDINMDDPQTNPRVSSIINKLKRGIRLGLSVGGNVTKESWEYNKELGKRIKLIDGVKLYEISVVGIPSNADSFLSISQAISKSAKNTCPMCFSKMKGQCEICLYQNV